MTIADVKKKRGRRGVRPSEEELAKLYAEHTAPEIAQMYGVSVGAVKKWISYYRKQDQANQETEKE